MADKGTESISIRKTSIRRISNTQSSLNGYMTVEASFIIPMVLCIFVILIYTSFYLYDRCCFTQDSYMLCFRESIRKDENTDRGPDAEHTRAMADKQFGKKYFALKGVSVNAASSGKTISVSGEATANVVVMGGYFLMPRGIWTMRFGASARMYDPPLEIRKYRRRVYIIRKAGDLVSGLGGE